MWLTFLSLTLTEGEPSPWDNFVGIHGSRKHKNLSSPPTYVMEHKDPSPFNTINIMRFIISIHESEKVLVLHTYLNLV